MTPSFPILERTLHRQPDFNNLLKVFRREPTSRPVLFEMAPGVLLMREPMGDLWLADEEPVAGPRNYILAQRYAGYDGAILPTWTYRHLDFPKAGHGKSGHASLSQNDSAMIKSREEFENYPWPTLDEGEYARVAELAPYVPEGMNLIARSVGGIQENALDLLGFEDMCLFLHEEPDLVEAVVGAVGERMLRHFELLLEHDFVGAIVLSDDWGFKTSTILPPDTLRHLIMPWHKRIVDAAHARGKAAILHSCGQVAAVMDDVIDGLGYDAKHSFEDAIMPVEQVYTKWGQRIGILGGIDMDLLTRGEPAAIHRRAQALLQQTSAGGYALGSGNSIPTSIPAENYFAMVSAAL